MNWNSHYLLAGQHARLSASKYSWLNYDREKFIDYITNSLAAAHGTKLHEFAAMAITLKRNAPRNNETINKYINDAIQFRMTPEQILFVSDNCFGTADAISFRKNILRIHDLKTGKNKANIAQLHIYAAMFCIEYGINPNSIDIVLRIYQNDEIREQVITPSTTIERVYSGSSILDETVIDPIEMLRIMNHILECDKIVEEKKEELLW